MEGKLIEIEGIEYKLTFTNRKINLYKVPPTKQIIKLITNESTDYTLNNKYLLLPVSDAIYCLFFNINNHGSGPNPSSYFTQIEIFLDSPNKTSIQIAEAIKDKIDSTLFNYFETSITDNELLITNKQAGSTFHNYLPRDANTNFTLIIEQYGEDGNNLIKSNFPENHGSKFGVLLYEILDVDLEPVYNEGDLTGADLLVNGIYQDSKKYVDKYNNVSYYIYQHIFSILDKFH